MSAAEKKTTLGELAERLQAMAWIIEEAQGEVTDEVAEVLEAMDGLEVELADKADRIAHVVNGFRAMAAARKERAKRENAAAKALENKADRLTDYLSHCLTQVGVSELDTRDNTFKFKKLPAIAVIDNEDALMGDFLKEKTTITPDKAKIKKALQSGVDVIGAHLETDRTKLVF
jgi:regulator of sigma D